MGLDPVSKAPAPGDIGIVLVHGWNRDLGDCPHFAEIAQSGEQYFGNLVFALRSQFKDVHPLWAFTYPSFHRISKSGSELAQELAQLLSTDGLSGLIIVGHSMGGLVAREAAQQLEADPATKGKLRGIITLGTPHLGAPLADFLNRFPIPGLDETPGFLDLIEGLQARLDEEVPIFASSGDITGLSSGIDEGLRWFAALSAFPGDGVVPIYSASPAFISRGKAYTPLPYDHFELYQGDNLAGVVTDPLYQRIFTDIRTLAGGGPQSPTITLSSSSASFSATVGGADPGAQSITITNSGTGTLSGLTTSVSYQSGQPGGWLSASLDASTAPATLTLTATIGALTTGTYNANVAIPSSASGVTNSPQTISVTLTVTSATPATLAVTTTSLPSATVGTGYGQGLAATGGQTPYTWSVSSGLPPGLAINTSVGSIFGAPTTAGTYTFTVTVSDASNPLQTASKTLAITVVGGGTGPGIFPLVSATASCSGSHPHITLTWTASSGVTTYDVYRNGSLYSPGVPAGTLTFLNTGSNVTPGTTYTYFIRARNANGTTDSNSLQATALICPGTLPGAFPLVSATPSCSGSSPQIRLTWTASTGVTTYDVYRNGSLYSPGVPASTLTFLNTGSNVTLGTTYTYFIRARNAAGTRDSNTLSATAPSNCGGTLPGAFTLVSAAASCSGSSPQITLTWTPSSGVTTYDVYRNGSLYSPGVPASTLTFLNTGSNVTLGTTYTYFIRARNAAGTRDSNTLSATAPTRCP